jgi:hypothetical protein
MGIGGQVRRQRALAGTTLTGGKDDDIHASFSPSQVACALSPPDSKSRRRLRNVLARFRGISRIITNFGRSGDLFVNCIVVGRRKRALLSPSERS